MSKNLQVAERLRSLAQEQAPVLDSKHDFGFARLTMATVQRRISQASGPIIAFYDITPEFASEVLQHHFPKNRRPKQHRAMNQDMESGRWRLTGDAIEFDSKCRANNGWHRLTHIVKAGVTLPCAVAMNMPDDSVLARDRGQGRTIADIAQFMGIDMTIHKERVLRRTINGISTGGSALSPDLAIGFYRRYRSAIDLGYRLVQPRDYLFRRASAAHAGAIAARARICGVKVSTIERFFHILRTGETDGNALEAGVLLYGRVLQRWHDYHGGNRRLEYAAADHALWAFQRGDVIEKYPGAYKKSGDLTPGIIRMLGECQSRGDYEECFQLDVLHEGEEENLNGKAE